MSTKEEQTKLKNDKLLLGSLRNDIIEASTCLSQHKQAVDEESILLEEKKAEIAILEERKDEIFAEIDEERKAIKQDKIDLESAKVRSEKELEVLNKQKRSAMSELRRLNEWNFEAKEEKDALEKLIKALLIIEREKKAYISDIKVYKEKTEEVKEAQQNVLIDIKLAEDESEAKVYKNTREVERLQDIVEVLQEKKEQAENLLATAIVDKERIEVDLEIYEKRVAKKYEEAFPGKKLKLTKK